MSISGKLDGRSILVVGATGSLGAAVVDRLFDEGALLTLSGRDPDKLKLVSREESAAAIAADLSSETGRNQLIGSMPLLDGVVFATGIAPLAPVRYLKDTNLNDCLHINAAVPLLVIRDLLKSKKLNKTASIVFLSSVAARSGTAGYAAYAGSKAALEAAARCLAVELSPKAIRVNCIAPGMVESDMADAFAENTSEEAWASHLQAYPLGAGKPCDVASAVAFFLSSDSRWITGVTLPVDGGFSLSY
jgi:NAD(P)-dependent dehydrogenase (short-subunit alcohol dehydrogenase family)